MGLIGVAASIGLSQVLYTLESRAIHATVESDVGERHLLLQERLQRSWELLDSIAALFEVTEDAVDAEAFRAFCDPILGQNPYISAVGWDPIVTRAERAAYEAAARRDSPADYEITERDPGGGLRRAVDRDEYVPVRFIAPYASNEDAHGYDIGSEARRLAAIERARRTGHPTITERIRLVQEQGGQFGYLALRPRYRADAPIDTESERRRHCLGFVVGVFRVGEILETSLAHFKAAAIDVYLFDTSAREGEQLLHGLRTGPAPAVPATLRVADLRSASGYFYEETLEQGGREWTMAFVPTDTYVAELRTWAPVLALLAGLLITGLLAAYIAVVTDRAARIRDAAEEERLLARRLEQSQKLESLGMLAGGIAHDFNNLLVGILGGTDLALHKLPADHPSTPHLETVKRSAEQAAALTREMLAYAGKGSIEVQTLRASTLVTEMAQLLESSVSKNATLRYAFSIEPAWIRGDATQLRQVVMNLITNASDALGEETGRISLRTGTVDADAGYLAETILSDDLLPGPYSYIEVADTGAGMDDATRDRMFEPFFTTKFQGRGLGLAATLGIVRGHGGTLRVDAVAGRGTTVRVLLPQSLAPAATEAASDRPDAWHGHGSVLVIDDDERVRTVASAMLRDLGFKVLTGSDGAEGIEVFRAHRDTIDIVLMDMTMPGLSGVETFQRIRCLAPDARVVFSSGYNEEELEASLDSEEVTGFLRKPYTAEDLRSRLQAALAPGRPVA